MLIKLCQVYLPSAVRDKLKLYAGGEYKILPFQFFDGNTIQNSFFFI